MNIKKKRLCTRKRRALRRIGWALLALLLVNTVCHTYYLFPVQRLWTVEELQGCGRTKVVERMWQDGCLWYLTENGNTVLLAAQKPTLTGWQAEAVGALDCMENAPFHGGILRQGTAYYAFGRVDDPKVARVQLTVTGLDGEGRLVRKTTRDAGREDWFLQDGRWYFRLACEGVGAQQEQKILTAFDAAGNAVAEVRK